MYSGGNLCCLNSTAAVVLQPPGPYDVTLVNRQYHKGRSMVNTADVIKSMMAMKEVSSVRYASAFSRLQHINMLTVVTATLHNDWHVCAGLHQHTCLNVC